MAETVLIVDDEEPVRRTFREWLEQSGLDVQVLAAADAEAALVLANQHTIDLAILDWNLGAGNDGLQLLEDLALFNADVVAIMITGFAHQATPLDAMRMGVRDYLDKNQDLNRTTYLSAVQRQLERIRPAKRERHLHTSLIAFREALDKVLPLVRSAAALNDPVPFPEAVCSLFRFLLRTTAAREGVLLVRSYDAERQPAEVYRVYDAEGRPLPLEPVPFARSVAGAVWSRQEPCALTDLDEAAASGTVELQPFERGRRSLLAAPLLVAPDIQVVLELFDKQGPPTPNPSPTKGGGEPEIPSPPSPLVGEGGRGGEGSRGRPFTPEDHALVAAAADFGAEMLRQALAERQTHQVLFDAVGAALGASASISESLHGTADERRGEPPPEAVLDQLRQGWSETSGAPVDADETLRLVEAVRVLALRHGAPAVRHCVRLITDLRQLLDTVTGADDMMTR